MSFKEQEEFLDNVLEKIDNLLGGMSFLCERVCLSNFLHYRFYLISMYTILKHILFDGLHHAFQSCSLQIYLICKYWSMGNHFPCRTELCLS